MRGKTIQVFLTDGTARGIKLAEITSNIEQAILMPRSRLAEAEQRPETQRPGLYFLFGEGEDWNKPMAYIGQSMEGIKRIKQHDQKKDFWNYAVLVVSKTHSFTQTHIGFLEQLSIAKALASNRYVLDNSVSPKGFNVPETLEADLLDSFDTIKVLLATLGFPLFEELKNKKETQTQYFCTTTRLKATGDYLDDGFVVFKGSQAKLAIAPTTNGSMKRQREALINNKILAPEKDHLVFLEDYLFSSPNAAASQVQGRSSNGWLEWKTASGKTLDQVIRTQK